MKDSLLILLVILSFIIISHIHCTFKALSDEGLDKSKWYFANDGKNRYHGHSPDYPKQSISELNSLKLEPGDTVFLKSGDIFRGQINNPEDGFGITPVVFTFYETGNKPVITTAINESKTEDWFEYSTNLWSNTNAKFKGENFNVGILVFNDDSVGYNRPTEARVNDTIGEFWYNIAGDSLIVYCTSNPATYYGDIEVGINEAIFNGDDSDNITIDGLAFKWTGRHGIVWNTSEADTIEIRNCYFKWIGGSENWDGAGFQAGNGIEFYSGDYRDIIIENCLFEQIFDASISPQYPDVGEDLLRHYYHGNVHINVRYAFEFSWDTDGVVNTVHYNNNTHWRDSSYAFKSDNRWEGEGWQAAFVTIYDAQNKSSTDVQIKNNIFWYENIGGVYSAGVRFNHYPLSSHIDINNNLYYSPDAFSGDHALGNASGTEYYTITTWQNASGLPDRNGYNSDPDFKNPKINFRVNTGSDAVDGGATFVEYTTDHDGIVVNNPPNIGAYE